MNRSYIIILILFFIFSACVDKNEEVYIEYIKSYSETIKIIDNRNKTILNIFDFRMNDIYVGDYRQVKPWFEKLISVKQNSNKVTEKIDSILNVLNKNSINTLLLDIDEINNGTASKTAKLSKSELSILKTGFMGFHDSLKTIMGKDTIRFNRYAESINSKLNINNWNQISALSGNKLERIEIWAVLLNLKMNIKSAENEMMSYLFSMISTGCYFIYKAGVVVEPRAKIIPHGQDYTANIFLGMADSTIDLNAFIGAKWFEANEGSFIYKEKVGINNIFVQRDGYFSIKLSHDKLTKVPFQIEYELQR